tara:strand:- start:156 stop:332 length:177 start_codon:yes stop_codon:yes gene_type:complete
MSNNNPKTGFPVIDALQRLSLTNWLLIIFIILMWWWHVETEQRLDGIINAISRLEVGH